MDPIVAAAVAAVIALIALLPTALILAAYLRRKGR